MSFPDAYHREPASDTAEIESGPSHSLVVPHQLASEQISPTTPALTPGASATTDESDTDFQSAYSTSPRDSYGNFDHDALGQDQDITITTKNPDLNYADSHSLVNFPSTGENTSTFEDIVDTHTIAN